MNTIALPHATTGSSARHHTHSVGWLVRQSTRLRFNGKMACLLLLVLLCTLMGNLYSAFNTRDAIRSSIDNGLINQVEGVHQLLQQELQQAPESFLKTSREILNGLRWGEQGSGYFFLDGSSGASVDLPAQGGQRGEVFRPSAGH